MHASWRRWKSHTQVLWGTSSHYHRTDRFSSYTAKAIALTQGQWTPITFCPIISSGQNVPCNKCVSYPMDGIEPSKRPKRIDVVRAGRAPKDGRVLKVFSKENMSLFLYGPVKKQLGGEPLGLNRGSKRAKPTESALLRSNHQVPSTHVLETKDDCLSQLVWDHNWAIANGLVGEFETMGAAGSAALNSS
jgi:hypothetical protein